MTTWADTILSEAQTGKLECTVHDDYKEEEKESSYEGIHFKGSVNILYIYKITE